MGLHPSFKSMADTTVTVYNVSTRGAYGSPTWGTGVSYAARVSEIHKTVTDDKGEDVVATHRVWILSTKSSQSSITVESTVRLSGDSTTTQRRVVLIERPHDTSGVHHTVIELG